MLILLPPSETKRAGGDAARALDLAELSFATLTPARRRALQTLARLSRRRDAAEALRLGPTQAHEIERNRVVESAPTMPALDRFEGVLYEGLDAASLPDAARRFARRRLAIASALFGLLGPDDPIPAYRLSPGSRLPGTTLAALWRKPVSAVLAEHDGLVLDLRSEAYTALGPAPAGDATRYLRVVSEGEDGRRRALNHFNKKGKGEFTRALLLAGIDHPDAESLISWAVSIGIRLEPGAPAAAGRPAELTLVV
ncbi:YaaA family protein [Lysinimonas soli]|uniref:YaaA family protein n=1 Tax=Lysinimonas soli TaxID=1074233 RepID=A0ABW0NKR2_9MICO